MGLDFVGNPNKVEYEDIDEIGVDDYSEDENAEALANWVEVYESSEYDEAEDDSYIYYFSDSDTSNASEEPFENITNASESEEEEEQEDEEDLQQKGNNIIGNTKSADLKVSEEMIDLSTNEDDPNT